MQLELESRPEILTVTALNREARRLLERGLGQVAVEGELSNVARPASGHMYWTLKDGSAQIRCAMFRQANRSLEFRPEDGQQVVATGRVSLYEARGDYQLIVDSLVEAGEGLLRRRFEILRQKLAAEGLFDEARKRELPPFPSTIGVVTSPTGAAIHDVLTALRRRFPASGVLIYPTSVQGAGAAAEIVAALRRAASRMECDVLILTRGGGSLEDLWSFNEEIVARAVVASPIPVIVGVGHESDFTIADFVADLRAPTPSQAAELAVPVQSQLQAQLASLAAHLARVAGRTFAEQRNRLAVVSHRLSRVHPRTGIQARQQRVDEIELRLGRALRIRQANAASRMDRIADRLARASPAGSIAGARERVTSVRRELTRALAHRLERARARIAVAERGLHALSPLATLERGFAIVSRKADGQVIGSTRAVTAGTEIDVRLADGTFGATVTERPDKQH